MTGGICYNIKSSKLSKVEWDLIENFIIKPVTSGIKDIKSRKNFVKKNKDKYRHITSQDNDSDDELQYILMDGTWLTIAGKQYLHLKILQILLLLIVMLLQVITVNQKKKQAVVNLKNLVKVIGFKRK